MLEKCLFFLVCSEVMLRLLCVQLQCWSETMRTASLNQTKGLTPFLRLTNPDNQALLREVPKDGSEIRAVLWDCATPRLWDSPI